MPRHVVSSRPLEGEERDQLRLPPHAKVDEWGCALSVLAIAAMLGCGLGAGLQIWFRILTRMSFLPLVTSAIVVVFAWRVAGAIRRTQRETHDRLTQDHEEDAAEVVEVWDAVAVQQEAHDDEGPIYFLDIGDGRILVLCGPELYDTPEFRTGRPWPPREEDHEGREWEPPFLNSHFVLHRGRRSGRILRVDVLGEPIPVTRVLPKGAVPLDFERTAAIVDGSLETLADGGPAPTIES